MMKAFSRLLASFLMPTILYSCINNSNHSIEKSTYFPTEIWKVKKGNDFSDSLAQLVGIV